MSASFSSPTVSLSYEAPVPHPPFAKTPLLEHGLVDPLIPSSQDPLPLLVGALPPPVAVHATRRVHASSLVRPYEAEVRDPPLLLQFPHRHRLPRLEQAPDSKRLMPPRGPRRHSSEDERDRRPHPSVLRTSLLPPHRRAGGGRAGDGMALRHRLQW